MCRLFFFRDSPRNAQLFAAQVASDAIGAFAQHAHILLSIFYYIKKEARLQAIGKTISLQLPLFLFSFILNRHSLSVKKFTADFHK